LPHCFDPNAQQCYTTGLLFFSRCQNIVLCQEPFRIQVFQLILERMNIHLEPGAKMSSTKLWPQGQQHPLHGSQIWLLV
jgi:hypothetical protein